MQKAANPTLRPITIDADGNFVLLLEPGAKPLEEQPTRKGGWVNYFRQDDVSAIALIYFGKPENGLPSLPPLRERIADMAVPTNLGLEQSRPGLPRSSGHS